MTDFSASGPLCAVIINYTVPVETVDLHRADHIAFLKERLAEGHVLLAGRQVPATGGMVLYRGTRDEVEALVKADPYVTAGVVDFTIVEIATGLARPEIASLIA